MKKNIVLYISAVLVVLFILACFLPISSKVDIKQDGILWSAEDSSLSQPVSLTVRGSVRRYLFRENTFIGSIMIGKAEKQIYTKEAPLFLHNNHGVQWGSLGYYSAQLNRVKVSGMIYTDRSFSNSVIMAYENDKILSFPASDRTQAVETAKRAAGAIGFTFS